MPDLEALARRVAHDAPGRDAIEDVAVAEAEDALGRSAPVISFLIGPDFAHGPLGGVRTDLRRRLRDGLLERGEEVPPIIRFFAREDWERVPRA